MKKLLSICLVCCLCLPLAAQTASTQNIQVGDTVTVNPQTTHYASPTRLVGRIVSVDSRSIAGATITLGNQNISTTTNQDGEFTLVYLEPGDEEIIVEANGYIGLIELVELQEGRTADMGNMVLQEDIALTSQEEVLLNLSEQELNDDEGKSQSMASAASASQDVFNNITSFAWSNARYRNRGYEQRYEQNYINGLSFNSAERGQFNFSAMGGLNDASRHRETMNPLESNNFTFGSLGNSTNYLMNASRFAQGWKIGVAGTNRNYKAALRATYASGLLPNGWAFVGQLAFRFSPYTQQKGIIGEGIDYYSLGYFFAAEKTFSNQSHLNLVTFGAPTRRGQSSALTQEIVDLTGSINYNPYWGYQDGKIRNSRIVESFDPTVIANYDIKFGDDKQHQIKVAAGYHYSWYSNSALNYFNAPDPRPDYYRNLPSFLWDGQLADPMSNQLYNLGSGTHYPWGTFIGNVYNKQGLELGNGFTADDGNIIGPSVDKDVYNDLVNKWRNRDNKTTQVNWDNIYAANLANNVNNPNGCSRYILERRHNDIQEGMASFHYNYTGTKHLNLILGAEAKVSQGIHYKTADDLLGGNQWLDVDPFAERDIKELANNLGMTQNEIAFVTQNDLARPNQVINNSKTRFGYDYRINMTNAKVWLQNEWNFREVDFYYALQVSYNSMQRTTNMVNGRAWYLSRLNPRNAELYLGPDAQTILSKVIDGTLNPQTWMGQSHHFVDPSLKLGLTYKINGRNHIRLNAMAQTTAPMARDAYISARVHDRAVENIYIHDQAKNLKDYYAASEKVAGGDLTYEFNYPIVRGRITGFYTRFWDGIELNGYYDDEANTFVNQTLTGLNRRHFGLEAAAAFKLGTYFTLTPAITIGDYRYTDNALSVTSAENGMSLSEDKDGNNYFELRDSVYMKGVKVSSGPQLCTSLKLSFFHPKMWFADVTVSYFDWNYLDVAPSRRMVGLYKGIRAVEIDGKRTSVDGSFRDIAAIETTDGEALRIDPETMQFENARLDQNGFPVLRYPYNIMTMQESLSATNPLNRFLVDVSVGKLIYLKDRQSLSINLTVNNLLNNTHFKTGGYQQARLPRGTRQAQPDYNNSVITANAWKYPSKYYFAWGTNFYLTLTYKF